MRIKHSARIAAIATSGADEFGIKPSRAGRAVRAEQAERLLRQDGDERPTTRKPKKGKQGVAGRTRVDRAREVEEVESLATYGSWGYVGPRGMVSNVRDDLTVGVVEGSGADFEVDLPKYRFDPATGRASHRVKRGLVVARYWRRFGHNGIRCEIIRTEGLVRFVGYTQGHHAVDITVRLADNLRDQIKMIWRQVR